MRAALVLLLLLVPATSLHVRDNQNACPCLSYKKVYQDYGVTCGQGYEASSIGVVRGDQTSLPDPSKPLSPEFRPYNRLCPYMMQLADFSKCVNKFVGPVSDQWCYTSSDCEGADPVLLAGGKSSGVAIKNCTLDDDLMNQTRPEELTLLANQLGLNDAGMLGRMSYPMAWNMDSGVEGGSVRAWSDLEAASQMTDEQLRQTHTMEKRYGMKYVPRVLTPLATSEMWTATHHNGPMIYESDLPGMGGGTVVWGTSIYGYTSVNSQGVLGYKLLRKR